MLMLLTWMLRLFTSMAPNGAWIESAAHEFRAAARGRSCDPSPCVCSDGRLRARSGSVRRSQGHAAASDGGLDLGRPDGCGRLVIVLDPRDQDGRAVRRDPPA